MHGRLGSKLRDKTRQDFQGVRRAVNVIALLVVVIGTNPTQATHTVLAPPGSSCDEACGRLQRVCRPESLDQVNSNASIHIAAQKAIQHLFHSDGNTGLWAHYRPSSFDEPSSVTGGQRDWMDLVDIPPEFSMCTVSLLFGSEGRVFNSAGHWRHGHVEEHAGHVDYAVTKPIDSPVCTNRTCFTIRTMGGWSMSQQTVQAHCAEYGESLAILKSAEEVDLVKNLIKTAHYDSAFWVGATSSSPDFKLRWDDDTEVDTSLFGPNHVATELIGSLWFRAYDFAWGVHTSPPGCCTYIPRGGICQRVGTLFSVD